VRTERTPGQRAFVAQVRIEGKKLLSWKDEPLYNQANAGHQGASCPNPVKAITFVVEK
jgi:hypothetical protein